METFPHLQFVQKVIGPPRFHGGGSDNPKSLENKRNRTGHSSSLQRWTAHTRAHWNSILADRQTNKLAPLNDQIVPVFLQINPDLINAEFDLESLGIEIISQEEDGYIVGASLDNFRTLEEKISAFMESKHGSGIIADLWKIYEGNSENWRPEHILTEDLYKKWNEINDDETYRLEVSIAFDKPIGKEPDPNKQGGQKRLEEFRKKLEERDDLLMERETHFQEFISHYGTVTSTLVHLNDSFGCEVEISGKGLKDLVVNYQFVFEVAEIEDIAGIDGIEGTFPEIDFETLPPDEDSIEVGVIDSGIMEGHKYLSNAIKPHLSRSYLNGDTSTADHVGNGGHGTKVAGAILYPNGLQGVTVPYKLPCFIRNLRVLNNRNKLTHRYPADLMSKIVTDNPDCKIFNLSISSHSPYRDKHMSTWATMIDQLSFDHDILFLIAVGNIRCSEINYYLSNSSYPDYLHEPYCRLANPAQSSFSIAVGSINHVDFEDNDWKSLGNMHEVSAYSRIGTGIWGHIKPDVVEYGGGIVVSKNGLNQVKEHSETAVELLRSTLNGGNAVGRDVAGTSFSTPKVAHIAAVLKKLYPNENVNLMRALIVQGARLPNKYFITPTTRSIQHFGYGLPSLDRVTRNTDYRVTFYSTGEIKAEEAHLYSVRIPEALRGQGDEFDILIEVTLGYSASVRRTRQKTRSYLSTWLDWTTSKMEESFEEFQTYVLKEIGGNRTEYDAKERGLLGSFPWKLRERSDYGEVADISRNNGTLQKDWAIIKSYDLPDELGIAVRGHRGWDKNKSEVPYAISVSIEILGADVPIYESIRLENRVEIEV